MCGDFLGYEMTSDLNSIRIKILAISGLPDKVLIRFREELFSIALQVEMTLQFRSLVVHNRSGSHRGSSFLSFVADVGSLFLSVDGRRRHCSV
ncbi:hypothetical protein LINPERHAP2_LOCUS15534 [Linum perenne]